MKKTAVSVIALTMAAVSLFSACSGLSGTEKSGKGESSKSLESLESSVNEAVSESSAHESKTETETKSEPKEASTDEIAEKLSEMSLEEKIGQTLMVGIEGTEIDESFREFSDKYKFGTVILFGKNITSAEQLVSLTNDIKAAAGDIPFIIGMDEEGGLVSRLPEDVLSMPSALEIAGSESTEYCYDAGVQIGTQLSAFGLHTGFSPVLDIWSNPDNTVIGTRAYGKSSGEVCKYGISAMLGLKAVGAIPVAKHFPGHGDTETDSHYGLPLVEKTKKELWESELLPFKSAIENGVPVIMAAHILCTELDGEYPASMSKSVITDLLREEMGFSGVVITDDLTMGAVSENYTLGEAAVLAVNAGCDIVSVCFGEDNVSEVFNALKDAVESGEISEERIDEAAGRVLKLKADYKVSSELVELPDVEKLNLKTTEFLS